MGRDRAVFVGMMVARLGFVVSLVLGLGWLLDLYDPSPMLHILAGGITVLSVLLVAIRLMMLGKGGWAAIGAGLLGAAGAMVGLAGVSGLLHLVIMIAMVGLAEATVSKAKKQM